MRLVLLNVTLRIKIQPILRYRNSTVLILIMPEVTMSER